MGFGIAHAHGLVTGQGFSWREALAWAGVLAAFIQAFAAVVIVCLTRRLADLSAQALRRDAKEAARVADEAARIKPSFLRAIGMELDALAEQINSLKSAVDTRPPTGPRGVSPHHTLALRTSVFSTQLGKLRQVDDPLVLSVIHFYSDLGALQQAVDNTNAASDAYSLSDAHDQTRGKTTPMLETAVALLKNQISTSLASLEKLRDQLRSGGYLA